MICNKAHLNIKFLGTNTIQAKKNNSFKELSNHPNLNLTSPRAGENKAYKQTSASLQYNELNLDVKLTTKLVNDK